MALGPDLPPFFTDDEALAAELAAASEQAADPIWRLPLWPAYEGDIEPGVLPVIPGHQIVGTVEQTGFKARRFQLGARVGIAWLHTSRSGNITQERSTS